MFEFTLKCDSEMQFHRMIASIYLAGPFAEGEGNETEGSAPAETSKQEGPKRRGRKPRSAATETVAADPVEAVEEAEAPAADAAKDAAALFGGDALKPAIVPQQAVDMVKRVFIEISAQAATSIAIKHLGDNPSLNAANIEKSGKATEIYNDAVAALAAAGKAA